MLPKFVFRHQKGKAPTVIRSHLNPNRPVQDSCKIRFLCDECESLFSKWETIFKRQIYDPYHAGKRGDFTYGPWLLKFAASISWRALRATVEAVDRVPLEVRVAAIRPELIWRGFLLDKRADPGEFSQYLFLLDDLANNPGAEVPINFAFYIHRSAATGFWFDPARRSLFTFCVLCSMVVIGKIYLGKPKSWVDRLHISKGIIRPGAQIPVEVVGMIAAQANDHLAMSRGLSDRQKELEEEAFVADPDKTLKSGYLQTMAIDVGRSTGADPKSVEMLSPAVLKERVKRIK